MPALPAPWLDVAKPVLLPVGRDYLRNEIRERDATVTSLAKAVGVSRKHLSNVLNGHAPLLEPLLGQLCQALILWPCRLPKISAYRQTTFARSQVPLPQEQGHFGTTSRLDRQYHLSPHPASSGKGD